MILDSGERREFATGAVRDCHAGKGRMDLMPWDVCNELLGYESFIAYIEDYMRTGRFTSLKCAADEVIEKAFPTKEHAMIELSKHFENGCEKYGPDNWRKGINSRSYIDSTLRHWFKWRAGIDDEPHAVACLWNLVCCMWTIENMPELNDYAIREEK